jgi:hypothetical protein
MKLEELVEQFALNVAAQTEAIWRGDVKTGNKHARYRTAEAKAVLEEVAKGEGLVSFKTGQALKRWEEGTWALDPE